MTQGKHLIAGEWVGGAASFDSDPVTGTALGYPVGTVENVDAAVEAAEAAFADYAGQDGARRAAFLRRIAEEIDARGDEITAIGTAETGLPDARLIGERGRTVGQLRMFADHVEAGAHLDKRHDAAMPDRAPLPRPDLKLVQRPVGPVAVFGASNFPLAFSTAGGDTAAALAAGCPVVVKGHEAHPGTGQIIAEAIDAAIRGEGQPAGVFSFVHGGAQAVGGRLVTHPLIRAVGFTGSLRGGRALFDMCALRPEPIPFFGELGSINPMFLLPEAVEKRGKSIAEGWAGSLTMGCGQFCTNPGVAFLVAGQDGAAFAEAATSALGGVGAQPMLTRGIAKACAEGIAAMAAVEGVEVLLAGEVGERHAAPSLMRCSAKVWADNPVLHEEVFGPVGLIVEVAEAADMAAIAARLEGQLTATLHLDEADTDQARALVPVLERKAGRLLANGFATGVEVADAMVHGGPYPASTNFGATSVGSMAIRRFLRPVSYQNLPDSLLPNDLRG